MTDAVTKLSTSSSAQPACQTQTDLTLAFIRKAPTERLSHHLDSRPLQFERRSQTGSSLRGLVSGSVHCARTIARSRPHTAKTDPQQPKWEGRSVSSRLRPFPISTRYQHSIHGGAASRVPTGIFSAPTMWQSRRDVSPTGPTMRPIARSGVKPPCSIREPANRKNSHF